VEVGKCYKVRPSAYRAICSDTFGFFPYENGVLRNDATYEEEVQVKEGEVLLCTSVTGSELRCKGYHLKETFPGCVMMTPDFKFFWSRLDQDLFEPLEIV